MPTRSRSRACQGSTAANNEGFKQGNYAIWAPHQSEILTERMRNVAVWGVIERTNIRLYSAIHLTEFTIDLAAVYFSGLNIVPFSIYRTYHVIVRANFDMGVAQLLQLSHLLSFLRYNTTQDQELYFLLCEYHVCMASYRRLINPDVIRSWHLASFLLPSFCLIMTDILNFHSSAPPFWNGTIWIITHIGSLSITS